MKTPICPECEYQPDVEKEWWDKLLITHIVNSHDWLAQDAEDYVMGRPYNLTSPEK